jgi:hypothetical protein
MMMIIYTFFALSPLPTAICQFNSHPHNYISHHPKSQMTNAKCQMPNAKCQGANAPPVCSNPNNKRKEDAHGAIDIYFETDNKKRRNVK